MRILLALLAVIAGNFQPGHRVLLDAHNCYPYEGQWNDRIERALGAKLPLAIEQDLGWYTDTQTGRSRSVLVHEQPYRGNEPTLESYFFNRIRPIVEQALKRGKRDDWPLVTLNLDFKSEEPQHLQAVWELLERHKAWLTTAERVADGSAVMPLDVKPVLVLTGESDAQEAIFQKKVRVGERLLVFGAKHPAHPPASASPSALAPEEMMPTGATNYRRWWNNPWNVVEEGGQMRGGAWTDADSARLSSLVNHAHRLGLWIRFYTLNGHSLDESLGWTGDYNFGSREAVRLRWMAAIKASVDFIATDQYEELARLLP